LVEDLSALLRELAKHPCRDFWFHYATWSIGVISSTLDQLLRLSDGNLASILTIALLSGEADDFDKE
jgi:hypothetical protein